MLKTKHVLPWALLALATAYACGGGEDSGGNNNGGKGGRGGSGGSSGDASSDTSTPNDGSIPEDTSVPDGGGDATDSSSDAADDADAGFVDPNASSVVFTITPASERRPISPHIYGVDDATAAAPAKARAVGFGERDPSGYNWEVNATNVKQATLQLNVALGSGTPGAAARAAINAAKANDGVAMLPVPIGDYVAADANGDDVMLSADRLNTRFKRNVALKGSAFTTTPVTSDAFVYQDEFVNWAKGVAGSTPVTFQLDHEPALWEVDHPAFHSTKASYDDVVNRGLQFARAIKNAWPAATVAGPVGYGWLEFLDLQESPDFAAKGEFLDYYLTKMSEAGTAESRRLLDYLDVHWYPEATGGGTRIIFDQVDEAVVAARLQAPRGFWDPTYREESWIQYTLPPGQSISLLTRLKQKIAQRYPGTKLAVSAWQMGGGGHISGALATVDTLGILGREGVDLAIADLPDQRTYTLAAFKAFLDYDGGGASFGDTSVAAKTDNPIVSSVYASVQSSADSKLVIIAINKRTATINANVVISGSTSYTTCKVWKLTGDGAAVVADAALTPTQNNRFTYAMPPRSVAVIVPQAPVPEGGADAGDASDAADAGG